MVKGDRDSWFRCEDRIVSARSKRKSSCRVKVAHSTRDAALAVLEKTLPEGMIEQMQPYPCLLCGNWHNGHAPVADLIEYEAFCGCGHAAADHRRFPNRGCLICGNKCASTLEETYRRKIKHHADSALWKGRFATWLLRRWPALLRGQMVAAFRRDWGQSTTTGDKERG
jgi:hypothetical protein